MSFSSIASIKQSLRRVPLLVSLKSRLFPVGSKVNILKTFPLFIPYSVGPYKDNALLTIQSINQTIPLLSSLAASLGIKKMEMINMRDFPKSVDDRKAAETLKVYFDKHGSDKANGHDYHYLYGCILKDREAITGIFEVGLGTNNIDVVSNMGARGKPGASLRAFRDFAINASIYGADVDKRVLFQEERIETFFVDQTDSATFNELEGDIPGGLDLVIDDGLHSPDANIETLKFGLKKLRVGGWVVIEDIGPSAIPVWEVVAALLPSNFKSCLLRTEGVGVFAVQRLG